MSRERRVIHWRKSNGDLSCLSCRGKDSETANPDTWRLTAQEKCPRCASWVARHSEVLETTR